MKKKNKKIMIWIIVLVLILVSGILIYTNQPMESNYDTNMKNYNHFYCTLYDDLNLCISQRGYRISNGEAKESSTTQCDSMYQYPDGTIKSVGTESIPTKLFWCFWYD